MLIRRALPTVAVVFCLSVPSCDPGQSIPPPAAEGGAGSTVIQVPNDAPKMDEPEPETQNELVDDLEDGDLTFRLPDGEGYWQADSLELSAVDGGANDTDIALRATSDGSASSFSAWLAPEDASGLVGVAHDYSSCDGIELWAKLGADADADEGVLVVAANSRNGVAGAELPITAEWQRFAVDWADFGSLAPRGVSWRLYPRGSPGGGRGLTARIVTTG